MRGRKVKSSRNPKWPIRRVAYGALLVLLLVGMMAASMGYARVGRSPREIMDYLERRLIGHPRIEVVALPVIGQVRAWLHEPSLKERRQVHFVVPPPPSLIKTAEPWIDTKPAEDPFSHVLRVGPDETIRSIDVAAKLARDGDTVEIQAGEYHGDVAIWQQKRLTIRGVGGHARLFADGKRAGGKGIWVIVNGNFLIENIDFIGAVVDDKNGAGIRFEGGTLRVNNCLFYDNQNGILTSSTIDDGVLEISNSEFGYNGIGDGLTHNLYVGKIKKLKVTGSYFHHANFGHLLKSRAQYNEIMYNRLSDEVGGRASYELEFSNGGIAYVVGNIIQQGSETENSIMISYGVEGLVWTENALYLSHNTLVNDQPYGGTFVRATKGLINFVSVNNLLVGKGGYDLSGQTFPTDDVHADWDVFVRASRQDYRLTEAGQQRLTAVVPVAPQAGGKSILVPTREYVHPRHTRPLAQVPRYVGAQQTVVAGP